MTKIESCMPSRVGPLRASVNSQQRENAYIKSEHTMLVQNRITWVNVFFLLGNYLAVPRPASRPLSPP